MVTRMVIQIMDTLTIGEITILIAVGIFILSVVLLGVSKLMDRPNKMLQKCINSKIWESEAESE